MTLPSPTRTVGFFLSSTRLIILLHMLSLGAALSGADSNPLIEPGAKLEKLSNGFEFTEGPAADRAGNVYFTDQPNDRIVKYSTDGVLSDWLKPAGRSNGTYFDVAGNLITCADEYNQLWSIAPDKTVTVLLKDFARKLLNGPNDLWITPANNIYFTDPLYKRAYWKRSPQSQQPGQFVYYLDRKSGSVRVVDSTMKTPNGIIGTPDGKTLYISDLGGNKTFVYTIAPNGDLTEKKLFCALGSDGMTIDSEGNVYLCGKGVTVFNPRGEKIEHIAISEPWTANITFGGKDKKLLFMTASKAVYTLKMRVSAAQ